MERLLLNQLLSWKNRSTRQPILIDGARQVGKSYLLEHLFAPTFERVHILDFNADRTLADLFDETLYPDQVVQNIEIKFNTTINLDTDLLVFDEIGECQAAVDSLKYFAEQTPTAFIAASGSNIGLIDSFPVGKVQVEELFPLSFEEFLMASGRDKLLESFRSMTQTKVVHTQLWATLLDYYFVGGMPEAVKTWYGEGTSQQRSVRVTDIHRQLLDGYTRDFGKYSGKVDAQHIETVFTNVARQLAKNVDGSVQRFRFKGVVPNQSRYRQLSGPIDWLEKSRLVSKCYPIASQPTIPFESLIKPNIFKLFAFDVGVLRTQLRLTLTDVQDQDFAYKGYVAENFVQNELRSNGLSPTYSWEQGRSQIEFLHRSRSGDVIPVEVKSGTRTKAKSLRAYIDRYEPSTAVKLIGSQGSEQPAGPISTWPLYHAASIADL